MKLTLLTAFLFAFNFSMAFQQDTVRNEVIEEGYIEKITGQLGIKVSLNNDLTGFNLKSGGQDIEVLTNGATQTKFGLQLGVFSFTFLKFSPDLFGDNSDPEKGDTDSWGLGTDIILGRFLNTVNYTKIDGFYVDNTSEFNPSFPEPYILLPNHAYRGFELSTGYRTNTKFSFKAYNLQTQRQLKSAGTFLPQLRYKYMKIEDKTDVLGESRFVFDDHEISLGLGYFYTYVINDFFVTAGVLPGVGIGFSSTEQRSAAPGVDVFKSSNSDVVIRYDAEFALGYNGRRFFGGFETNFRGDTYEAEALDPQVTSSRLIYQLYIGMRFPMPKFIREIKAEIEQAK